MDDIICARLLGIGRPIYVTAFGSRLYGLATPNSDTDHVCVFLPHMALQLLGGYENAPHSFVYSTKQDERAKNTAADVDIRFISLQRLLRELANSVISAIDILYSWTNKAAIHFDAGFERVFSRRAELLNLVSVGPFEVYGFSQIQKYGPKGSALGIAESVLGALEGEDGVMARKLGDIFEDRIKPHLPPGNKFWNLEEISGGGGPNLTALRLFDALHPFNISVADFRRRVQGFYDKWGKRAKMARDNSGIDWKAASHAMRGLLNYNHLLKDGDMAYPFVGAEKELLLNIKQGNFSWIEYERLFLARLEAARARQPVNRYNPQAAMDVILAMYGDIFG